MFNDWMRPCLRPRAAPRSPNLTLDPVVDIQVVEEGAESLATYADVPIAFRVDEVLDVERAVRGDVPLGARRVDGQVIKDYDAIPGNHPREWWTRHRVATWGIFAARIGATRVGGAVVVAGDAQLMPDGRGDEAVLWDIRVLPAARRRGVGAALLAAAEAWARARRRRTLTVETQDVNVPACRFYAANGFTLRSVRRGAYAALPAEVQLIWAKELGTTVR
jgi:ribosomal protein S18 acetylase RimI-like enzyme